ncbi:PepSY domain-containing protein [Rhodobium gokarnense]|uniref:PepSY domain-containing protein n=1 Tax=Rhodobium gokarnense TaxID=364296 RepID=A0ABT3HBU5_9HYPH|nr:hypothetical protein [Rhodobium gokarnense]MCW2307883.1 hypothetical protein [Rhodobium gokarnense]
MTNWMRQALLSVLLVLMVAGLPAAASAECLNHEQARRAVARGEAVSLSVVRHKARGEIVKARLCKSGRRYFYRVTVLSRKGKVRVQRIGATP